MTARSLSPLFMLLVFSLVLSCKTSGPGIFGKKSPHEQYGDRLTNAGLRSTVLGNTWFTVAAQSIASPMKVSVPYVEKGYFSSDRPNATALRFAAQRGQKIRIALEKNPVSNFTIYLDVWKATVGATPKHIASADTSTTFIEFEPDENAEYILRLQPELLISGDYTISVSAAPSLAYPIKAPGQNHTKSFWGADRDGGARRHEGIDMFAARRTPVVAAVPGRITRVHETAIGGKVVWLRAKDREYTLYYAHLDTQLVEDGDLVKVGDTLGLMGNTGNAKTTSPHLHFGVYTSSGPVDPWPFVDPVEKVPGNVTQSAVELAGKPARHKNAKGRLFPSPVERNDSSISLMPSSFMQVEGASVGWFRVKFPSGLTGFLKTSSIEPLDEPLRTLGVTDSMLLFERPDSLSPKKASIPKGQSLEILALSENFRFVRTRQNLTGWIPAN